MKWFAAGTEPDFSKPIERLSDRSIITLGSGNEIPTNAVFVSANDIQKASSGQGKLFVWGHATYRDVFPDTPPRNFHFCLFGTSLPQAAKAAAAFDVHKPECNYSD